jgi:catechol 2,3-dioxygenase-like lactoylglutathione lyase family enzyme
MTDMLTTETDTGYQLQGVSHVSIQVRDLERSLAFYRDFLGFKVWLEFDEDFKWTRDGQEFVGRRQTRFLRLADLRRAPFLVLGAYASGGEPPGEPAQIGDLGIDHIGLEIDHVDALQARARELGVDIVKEVVVQDAAQFGHPEQGVVRTIMLRDPDGTYVQIDEWISG